MNRFFSKLDLRDIKISPEGSRFPPDADEQEAEVQEAVVEPVEQTVEAEPEIDTPQPEIDTPQWESPVHSNGHLEATETVAYQATETIVETTGDVTQVTTTVAAAYAVEGVTLGDDGEVLKVSARSRPSAVAGAIAGVVREAGRAEVQAIGAGATNQAVKAVAIAREYLRETGIDAVCVPAFIDVTIENEDRTAIRLVIEPR